MTKKIVLLGSTGSIGQNTLDVVRRLKESGDALRLEGLSTQSNLELIKAQIMEFRPPFVTVGDMESAIDLRRWAKVRRLNLKVLVGVEGLVEMARLPSVDLVVSAVVGSVGLRPLLAAVRGGKKIALANKEALIAGGNLIMSMARRHKATILPVDSEHSAIFQCLQGAAPGSVRRLILTASGGAFYKRKGSLDSVSPEEALDHPTWKMGKKITVDCATLTNKGLEAIEAHYLFNIPMDNIDIVIHPQSIVHSMVEFTDGAVLAQLSHPDMRLPIQYALTHPDRCPTPLPTLRLEEVGKLEFFKPDFGRFPCLALALKAGRKGGPWPAVFNGSNEVAVRAFLNGEISFTDIARVSAAVLASYRPLPIPSGEAKAFSAILTADAWAREKAQDAIRKKVLK